MNDGERFCPICGHDTMYYAGDKNTSERDTPRINMRKDPGMALVMSMVVPGLGQMYNGEMIKGFIILFFSVVFMVGAFAIILPIIICILIWLFGMFDAYNRAKEINAEEGK